MQAARGKAEELMEQAIENELAIKSQLDMEHQRLSQVENEIELEREKVCLNLPRAGSKQCTAA